MQKKKILFLLPSLAGGGAERTLINVLQHLDYNKYDVDLVSVLNDGPYLKEVPKEVRLITLFNHILLVRILAYFQKKIGFNLIFKLIMQQKIKNHYEVGISFLDSNYTDFLFFITGIKKRYAWVHSAYKSYNNFAKYYENSSYREKLKKKRYSALDGIFFVSQDAMDEFIDVFGKYSNMQVIYNLMNPKSVLEKSKGPLPLQKKIFTFVAVGSLLPVKGFDRLIRSAKIIKGKGYSFRLQILGSGSEEEKLNKLIIDNELEGCVELKGFVSNPYPYMMQADVFVMSSVSEALPTVLCEAMILGKPTLVTNCSGCREIVQLGEYGLMAEQNDNDLADKMLLYLTNQDTLTHFKVKSEERALVFDDNKVLKEYYKVLDS